MWNVNLEQFHENKDIFLKMSTMTELDVQIIYKNHNEPLINDFTQLVYHYDAPLSHKMIWRFRNCEHSPSRFYHQIDPICRANFLRYFNIHTENFDKLMEFTAWLKNGLGDYDIRNLASDEAVFIELKKLWDINELIFFFSIPLRLQKLLIKKYNTLFN